jgi:tripartite-type tricarboxylate transporter receptor subunit TctC
MLSTRRHLVKTLTAALLCSALIPPSFAQTAGKGKFPEKTVKIVVAFSPGGPTDVVARVIAQKLSEKWGQPVIVENRAGASGVIGSEFVARSPADGYTLLMATMGNLAVNPYLYPKKSMALGRDYDVITQTAAVDFVLFARTGFQANTVKDLIAMAKTKPEAVSTATSGVGGAPDLSAEQFMTLAGVKLLKAPYKGTAEAVNAVLGGEVDIDFDSVSQVLPHIHSGRVKPLAVLGKKRSPLLPNVPTMEEAGLQGYELTNWFGLVAPAGTPAPLLNQIHADVSEALRQRDVVAKFIAMGLKPGNTSPEQFKVFVKNEYAKWGTVIKRSNISAN